MSNCLIFKEVNLFNDCLRIGIEVFTEEVWVSVADLVASFNENHKCTTYTTTSFCAAFKSENVGHGYHVIESEYYKTKGKGQLMNWVRLNATCMHMIVNDDKHLTFPVFIAFTDLVKKVYQENPSYFNHRTIHYFITPAFDQTVTVKKRHDINMDDEIARLTQRVEELEKELRNNQEEHIKLEQKIYNNINDYFKRRMYEAADRLINDIKFAEE